MKRWFLLLVAAWIAFHLLAYFILPSFIPYLGFFPYKEAAAGYNLPGFITSMANFDGEHYLLIAKNGYSQYEQAFFPLYPILIRFVGIFFNQNYLLSAIVISSVSFFFGLFFFKNYIQQIVGDKKDHLPIWRWSQLLLLLFPTAFFFTAVYTEGLFFMLCMATLYFLNRKNFAAAAVFAFLAALTRLVGVFLFIPIFFSMMEVYFQKYKTFSITQFIKLNIQRILVFIAPFLGLASYCLYLWKTSGDPLFFLNAQSAFGANRSSELILLPQVIYRYLKIFFTAQPNFQYFISFIEFCFFLLVFGVLLTELIKLLFNRTRKDFYNRFSLNLFSFVNLLLPTFTGTLSSVPRYALMSFSFFLILGEYKNMPLKIALLVTFGVLHIILFGFFIQGYFVS